MDVEEDIAKKETDEKDEQMRMREKQAEETKGTFEM